MARKSSVQVIYSCIFSLDVEYSLVGIIIRRKTQFRKVFDAGLAADIPKSSKRTSPRAGVSLTHWGECQTVLLLAHI